MEMRQQTDVVVMDFAEAFDKVNHSLLLHKLHHYGVRNTLNQWIPSFFTNRRQAVVVDSAKSGYIPVCSGVPQGSVIGPVLFLSYIKIWQRQSPPGRASSPMTRSFIVLSQPRMTSRS